MSSVHVIGAGLAGCEAAHFLAVRGVRVILHEMRPLRMTEAHHTGMPAELVCSNSLKSRSPVSAPGILKAEMRTLGSLVLDAADVAQVPAGEALGVDRDVFSAEIDRRLRALPNVARVAGEVESPDFGDGAPTIVATGPLTAPGLSAWLQKATGDRDLYFYDAIAPIVEASTLDRERCFLANRYGKGEEEAYLNCPLDEAEYATFMDALAAGEKVPPKNFEKEILFQGCQPVESIAATGRDSLRFGAMKPVGLVDPRTGKRPWAVVQLRPENRALTAYNLVGFQTKLKYGEQSRIFRLIPALARAEFLRLGSIHRNTYVCGPRALRGDLSLKGHPGVYLAGQVTGVEGYLESAAGGMLAASFVLQRLRGQAHAAPPADTVLGALLRHVTGSNPDRYQPANAHFGLIDPTWSPGIPTSLPKDQWRAEFAARSPAALASWRAAFAPAASA